MDSRHRRVVWTNPALDHLDQAVGYLASKSLDAARRLVNGALDAAASLETLSDRGRMVPELSPSEIRELLIGSYRLIYAVTDEEVTILAFLHGARDLRRLLTEGFGT